VCFAFKLGYDGKHYRASDDGEPNNSAGQPILGQIQSAGLTQTLVAVVRFYGGTNLGVGGLVRAYRTAAKEALASVELVEREIQLSYELSCDYECYPLLMNEIKTHKVTILNQELDVFCKLRVQINIDKKDFWLNLMKRLGVDYKTLKND
jgi:putative IMPACT (imprinted ancient) family translation regulator